jgi:hypothetical protein
VRDRSIGGHFSTAQVPVGNLPTVRESYLRSREMNLYLRKVVDLQAHENYRVVLKLDGNEFVGSIGIQHGAAWRWEIDTVIPMRVLETQGKGKNLQGLHEAVQGCLGAVCRRRGQPGRVPERGAAAALINRFWARRALPFPSKGSINFVSSALRAVT